MPGVVHPSDEWRDQGGPRGVRVAALAVEQHGVVGHWQLLELGVDKQATHRLSKAGWLHPIDRGVSAVGHTKLTLEARWMAAVLACGPEAVLSHRDAVALWRLRPVSHGRST